MKRKTLYGLLTVLLIVGICASQLNFSDISTFNWNMTKDVIVGLFKPDFSYFYDGSGEDVFSLLITTIAIAILGCMIATVCCIPFMLLASSNLHKHKSISKVGKFILNVLRCFPELIYAIIFVKMVGPGPFAGVCAIGVHQIGMLGKLYTEEMEKIQESEVEGYKSVGATSFQTMLYGRLPKLYPIFISLSLNHFEIALRSATTLGLVGAGGIGAPLIFAIQARNFDKASMILLSVVVLVVVSDAITTRIRKALR